MHTEKMEIQRKEQSPCGIASANSRMPQKFAENLDRLINSILHRLTSVMSNILLL